MASISIADFRASSGVTVATQSDALAGPFIGAASAMVFGITNRHLGHYAETLTINGADVDATVYGHMLPESGHVWIAGSGSPIFRGRVEYAWLSPDRIRLLNVALPVGVTNARLFPLITGDFKVMDARIRVYPSPIYSVHEIKIDQDWGNRITTNEPFADGTILPQSDYFMPEEANPLFQSEIELRPNCLRTVMRRVPGYVRAVRQTIRRTARVSYYAGTMSIPSDLILAIGAIAKAITNDPMGDFQSESYDYYSYSRRSMQDIKDFPLSVLATLTRYTVQY